MELFNRVGEITIGKPGADGLIISGLNFSFDVKKTITAEMNPGSLNIYNLARETSASIHELEAVCIVRAGYSEADGLTELYRGYISKVATSRRGPDYVTSLELRDGYQELKEKTFSKSYSSGMSLEKIVTDIVKSLGLPEAIGSRLTELSKKKLKRGISFNGLSKDALDDMAKLAAIEWSVQSGKVKVLAKGEVDLTQAFYISKETGLVRSPERVSEIFVGKDSAGKDKKQSGWSFDALLLSRLEPGNSVMLESDRVNGTFKVVTVQHTGEIMGSELTTTVEVIEL